MPIRATMTGSWNRPPEIMELLQRSPTGEIDTSRHREVVLAAEEQAIADQLEAGLHTVSNGEQRKSGYTTYLPNRFMGFSKTERGQIAVPPDLIDELGESSPEIKQLFESGGKLPLRMRLLSRFLPPEMRQRLTAMEMVFSLPLVEAPLEYVGADLARQEALDARELARKLGAPGIFLPSPSPGVITLFYRAKESAYPDHEAFLFGLADELRKEYQTILEVDGVDLQIDAPDLAMGYHLAQEWGPDYEGENFYSGMEVHLQAINQAIEGLPAERIRLHSCYGNYVGSHSHDADFERILPILAKANVGMLVFEAANPQHEGDLKAIEIYVQRHGPPDQDLALGVIDVKTPIVESRETVAMRLTSLAQAGIDPDKIWAGTDCGFETFMAFGNVSYRTAKAKLRAAAQGAELANEWLNSH